MCVGVALRWAKSLYFSISLECNSFSIFDLYCLALVGFKTKGLWKGPDFCLLLLTVSPTPTTRCMMFCACSTMMHSSLHTHSHSVTHTQTWRPPFILTVIIHGPYLQCIHVILHRKLLTADFLWLVICHNFALLFIISQRCIGVFWAWQRLHCFEFIFLNEMRFFLKWIPCLNNCFLSITCSKSQHWRKRTLTWSCAFTSWRNGCSRNVTTPPRTYLKRCCTYYAKCCQSLWLHHAFVTFQCVDVASDSVIPTH